MNGGRDVTVDQSKPIGSIYGRGLAGEAELVQRAVKPITRTVTGKNASRPVAAVRGRRKAED